MPAFRRFFRNVKSYFGCLFDVFDKFFKCLALRVNAKFVGSGYVKPVFPFGNYESNDFVRSHTAMLACLAFKDNLSRILPTKQDFLLTHSLSPGSSYPHPLVSYSRKPLYN